MTKKKQQFESPCFLMDANNHLNAYSIFKLNIYLNALKDEDKPYIIDYNTLLMSYHMWQGDNLDDFCEKQTISYFLFNPNHDSAEAREALYLEIREFLGGN